MSVNRDESGGEMTQQPRYSTCMILTLMKEGKRGRIKSQLGFRQSFG